MDVIKLVVGTAVGLLIFGAVATGCGGGDTTALTKAQFLQKGNAICAKAEGEKLAVIKKAIDALPKNGTVSVAEQEKLVPAGIVKPIMKAAGELEEVGAPQGQEDQVQKIVTAMKEGAKEAEQNPNAVVTGTGDAFGELDELASKYGLKKCAL